MDFSQKVRSYIFVGVTPREAYITGCKQLAKFIASSKYTNLSFKAQRIEGKSAFRFTIYTNLDLALSQKEFCKICKEIHCSFFVNEEYNCSRCNMKSFLKRVKQKSNISKGFYLHRIKEKDGEIAYVSEDELE